MTPKQAPVITASINVTCEVCGEIQGRVYSSPDEWRQELLPDGWSKIATHDYAKNEHYFVCSRHRVEVATLIDGKVFDSRDLGSHG